MKEIRSNGEAVVKHLERHSGQLENLEKTLKEGFQILTEEIKAMRQDLIGPATSKKQIPSDIAMLIIRTLCWVIFALIIWFTGIKPYFPIFLTSHLPQVGTLDLWDSSYYG